MMSPGGSSTYTQVKETDAPASSESNRKLRLMALSATSGLLLLNAVHCVSVHAAFASVFVKP